MQKFNSLKPNDKIIINDYILKITGYSEEFQGYYVEGKRNNDCNIYIGLLVSDLQYNKMDEISKLYAIPFNKICEVK